MDEHVTDPATRLSTHTMVFLWGGSFAAAAPAGKRGTRAFATGAVVDTRALAEMMIAVTLAELHQQGLVRLAPFSRKMLGLLPVSGIAVHVLGEVAPRRPVLRRLDSSAKARERGQDVKDLVAPVLDRSAQPQLEVVRWGIDEAVEQGYLHRERAEGLKGAVGRKQLIPNDERIAATRPRAEELAQTWIAFRTADPALAQRLRGEIGSAIASREGGDSIIGDGLFD